MKRKHLALGLVFYGVVAGVLAFAAMGIHDVLGSGNHVVYGGFEPHPNFERGAQ